MEARKSQIEAEYSHRIEQEQQRLQHEIESYERIKREGGRTLNFLIRHKTKIY